MPATDRPAAPPADRLARPERPARSPRAEAKAEPVGPIATPGLTLATAFQLMARALGELGNGVGHEPLRSRMAALYGREDPLLDPSRFGRLLRQANDAEIADVRQVGEDAYEVSARPGSKMRDTQRHAPRETRAPEAAADGSAPAVAEPPVAGAPGNGHARGAATLRFRRGSRSPLRLSDVPLVGMVRMDAEPKPEVVAEAPAKPAKKEPSAAKTPSRRGPPKAKVAAKVPPSKDAASAAGPPAAVKPAPKRRGKPGGKPS